MQRDPVIEVRSLSVKLGDLPVRAVENLGFTLHKGEILGLAGESGSGKSVTALSLARLVPSSANPVYQGSVHVDGVPGNLLQMPARKLNEIRGKRIGYVFQEPSSSFNPVYSIRQHLLEIAGIACIPRIKRQSAISRALETVGISASASNLEAYPSDYSGGMLQRLAIACALLFKPQVLIADEPTTALDTSTQKKIVELLKHLNVSESLAVLFISHDLALLNQVSDRIIVMKDGAIVEQGKPGDILYNPEHPYTQSLVKAIPRLNLPQ